MTTPEQDRAALRRLAAGAPADDDIGPLIRRGTWVIVLLLWLFATAAFVSSAWLLLHHARSHAEATAASLEQFAERTITFAAFVANEYKQALDARGGVSGLAADGAASQRLDAFVKWLPAGSAAGVALADGTLALSTVPLPSARFDVSDRRWFQAPAREGLDGYVGPAVMSRVNKRFYFTYSTGYRAADGRLLAVFDLGIPSDSLTTLTLDEHASRMALVQHEGSIVAAQPFNAGLVGTPFALPAAPPSDMVTLIAPAFGTWSVATILNIPDLKLYAVVAIPVLIVLKPLLWGLAAGLPLLLLLTAMLVLLSGQLQKKSHEVEQALADNRVLFQEVHHRVKNNLQVISSLLRLQAERLPPEQRLYLDETAARVRAIALVHEQIYRTRTPSDVQLDRFLAELVQQLSASMIGGAASIATDLRPVTIGLDRAVPVAILATEAITNAIRHGLTRGEGEIGVSLENREGRIVLTVRDNGPGRSHAGSQGLGTRIISAVARQIDAEWSLEDAASGGTVFILSWPASA